MRPKVDLLPLPRGRLRAAASLLARALHDDPFAEWFIPDERRRSRVLRLVEGASLSDARGSGEVRVAVADGALVGVTAWLPPGAHRQGLSRQLRQVPRLLGAATRVPGRAADALRVADAERQAHPDVPHWWLVVVGVDPSRQGMGAGGRMVEALVSRADGEAHPAYLRTTNERNLGFYVRWGFEVCDEVRPVPAAPPMWLLWRDPRTT